MKSHLFGAACAVLFAFITLSANAAIVNWKYEGIVTFIDNDKGFLPLVPNIGSSFTAIVSFDNSVTDANTSTEVGDYRDAIQSVHIEVDGVPLDLFVPGETGSDQNRIRIENGSTASNQKIPVYGMTTSFAKAWNPAIPDELQEMFILRLFEATTSTPALLDSDSIPLSPLDTTFATYVNVFQWGFRDGNPNVDYILGEITSVSAVPIPPALYLFGSGLIGLVGMVRRRAKQ